MSSCQRRRTKKCDQTVVCLQNTSHILLAESLSQFAVAREDANSREETARSSQTSAVTGTSPDYLSRWGAWRCPGAFWVLNFWFGRTTRIVGDGRARMFDPLKQFEISHPTQIKKFNFRPSRPAMELMALAAYSSTWTPLKEMKFSS